MEPTKTEQLLRQAHQICQSITGRPDVSDALLNEVFFSLRVEVETIEMDEGDFDGPHPPGAIH